MHYLEIILLAFALALDAFAVSLGSGSAGQVRGLRASVRLAFHFGLFQALMPVAGWFLGKGFESVVKAYDHWIAFVLLVLIGGKMIVEAFRGDEKQKTNPSKGMTMVMLSIATSIDALVVGFSLALVDIYIWTSAAIIGIITGSLSFAGIYLGRRLGHRFGTVMEFIGGLILIAIGVKILFTF